MRRTIPLILSLFISLAAAPALTAADDPSREAESDRSRRGILPAIDRLMSSGRIAAAGRRSFPEPLAPSLEPLTEQPAFGSYSASDDYRFICHLFEQNLQQDALTLLCAPFYSDSDTLSYLRGKAFFESRRLYDASLQFERVHAGSPFHEAARFHDIAARLYTGDYDAAYKLISNSSGCREDLLSLDRAASDLLTGRFSSFPDVIAAASSSTLPQIRDAADELVAISEAMQSFRPRSPLLLAGASALVPGLGKMLSGRVGEGVSALLAVASLAAITAENAVNCGLSDWKTILFGSMTILSYTANIYGSYVSAQIYNRNTIQGYETAVVLAVRVPLRELFR